MDARPVLTLVLGFALVLAAPVVTQTAGDDPDEEEYSNVIELRGRLPPFAFPANPIAPELSYFAFFTRCVTDQMNEQAFIFLIPASLLQEGIDLYPGDDEAGAVPDEVLYLRDFHLYSDYAVAVGVNEMSLSGPGYMWSYMQFPMAGSSPWGRMPLRDEPYWWVFSCTGEWDGTIEYSGIELGSPVTLDAVVRSVWSEGDFRQTFRASSGLALLPRPAVGTEATFEFEVQGPQFLYSQVTESWNLSTRRMTAPDGSDVPFYFHHHTGYGVGGGGIGIRMENQQDVQVDRIVVQEGTWRLVVDPKVSREFEASVYRLDLSPLLAHSHTAS